MMGKKTKIDVHGVLDSGGLIKDLLIPFFAELDKRRVQYCVCGNYHGLPEYTSHDVDIWAEDTKALERTLFDVARREGFTLYLNNRIANGSNNFFFKNAAEEMNFVRIDVLSDCSYLSFIPIVRSRRIGEGRFKYRGFYVAEPVVEATMHLLYPLLHAGKVKEKYREKIHALVGGSRFRQILAEAVGRVAGDEIAERIEKKEWIALERDFRRYRLKLGFNSLIRDNIQNIKPLFAFIRTNVSRIFSPAGLFIVLIGPDGCGKTTLSDRLPTRFSGCFTSGMLRKFYWRPFLLPRISRLVPFGRKKRAISEAKEDMGLRTVSQKPLERVAYLTKFIYYWMDFVLGRAKYQSAWSRGGLVFFDRYYYDHMVYPERFGFSVPGWVMRFLKLFVPVPNLIFYLHAPAKRLLQRKQELPADEIIRQQREYMGVIKGLKGAHVIDTSKSVEETEAEIMSVCAYYMANRLRRRNNG